MIVKYKKSIFYAYCAKQEVSIVYQRIIESLSSWLSKTNITTKML